MVPAPFEGETQEEAEREVFNTYTLGVGEPEVVLARMDWKVVPLTSELERQYQELSPD